MTGRLAIVDDDPGFTRYLSTRLRSWGYTVDVFNTGASLLQGLREGTPPSVVLLDVLMPGLDGIETLKAVRRAHPDAQVIMLSGSQLPAQIVEAVRHGAADYVVKPTAPNGNADDALVIAIRNALARDPRTAGAAPTPSVDEPDDRPCWGNSAPMRRLLAIVDRVADSDVAVLLHGESGVGKEVISRELHRRSMRRARPFVKVNCSALPPDLLESELFGFERGAFTGAVQSRVGKFEFAQHGTILLDEIGDLPVGLQAKLLHVLQDGRLTRLGSNLWIDVDVRVIAATNRDLDSMRRTGTFRDDLYYRLQVIELQVPPLRERRDEIPLLVDHFLAKYSKAYRKPLLRTTPGLLEALHAYTWPGNIRQLENMVRRLVVLQDELLVLDELMRPASPMAEIATSAPTVRPAIESRAPGAVSEPSPPPAPTEMGPQDLRALSREAAARAELDAIRDALVRFRWNRRKAAAALNVSYKTLLNKMKECGLGDARD